VDGLHNLLARRASRRCVDFAARELPSMPPGTFAASVARRALQCARQDDDAGTADATQSAAAALELIVRNPSQPLLPSFRSNLYEDLVRYHQQTSNKERAQRLTREWLGFLETESILARNRDQRRVFDDHKRRAYLELGTPAKSLPMMSKTTQDFPEDYTAQARLAQVFMELRRWPDALAEVDRALPAARGQGLLRLVLLKAEILGRLRRQPEAQELLRRALEDAERKPVAIDHDRLVKELRLKLAALSGR
jgi:tetratricopeptide (TPR) repeat protein